MKITKLEAAYKGVICGGSKLKRDFGKETDRRYSHTMTRTNGVTRINLVDDRGEILASEPVDPTQSDDVTLKAERTLHRCGLTRDDLVDE